MVCPLALPCAGPNEGRRRPSLIAALLLALIMRSSNFNEGRRRPSLIAAMPGMRAFASGHPNEGRRRPSLIAARYPPPPQERHRLQRGAPAPLPHCGRYNGDEPLTIYANEGRRRPSLIAAGLASSAFVLARRNEGRRRPSLIAAKIAMGLPSPWTSNEGRRRPSLIAAAVGNTDFGGQCGQRGAPAPLPHCGATGVYATRISSLSTRGAGAPPSLRLCGNIRRHRPATRNEGRRRPSLIAARTERRGGRGRATNEGRRRPSLIAAWVSVDSIQRSRRQRGAPAPLPHCGIIRVRLRR